jgi:hypothetical protein
MNNAYDFLSKKLECFSTAELREGSERLTSARKLLEKGPDRWIKGDMARTQDGYCIEPGSPSAFCFCAWGAIGHVGGNAFGAASNALELALNKRADTESIVAVNDDPKTDYETILNAFDFAALLLNDEAVAKAEDKRWRLGA